MYQGSANLIVPPDAEGKPSRAFWILIPGCVESRNMTLVHQCYHQL